MFTVTNESWYKEFRAVLNHVLSHKLFSKAKIDFEECIDDPLFDANLDSYDSYIDPSVEHIEEVYKEKKSSDLEKENSLMDNCFHHETNFTLRFFH